MKRFISRVESRDALQNFKLYTMKFSDNVDSGILGLHRDKLWSNVANVGPKSSFKGMVQRTVYGSDVKKGDEVTANVGLEFALQIYSGCSYSISAMVAVYKMRILPLLPFYRLVYLAVFYFLKYLNPGIIPNSSVHAVSKYFVRHGNFLG